MYDAPKVMYLSTKYGHASKVDVVGETSRSWLTGPEWSRSRYAKSEYTVATQSDYLDFIWASMNRWKIRAKLESLTEVTPAQLRQIADIIGYKEGA
jgi:hypothetical protein